MEGPLTSVTPAAAARRAPPGRPAVEVAIVGAGPAGATAALVLARAGVEVVLLDRAPLPRDKTCGGGVVARALAALPPGVDLPVERRLVRVESRFVDAGVAVTVERAAPLVHMAMRAPLDLALAEAARAAGAALRAPCTLARVELTPDHLQLETSGGPLRARFLIAADGATGPTARAAGWTEPLGTVPALEAEVEVPPRVLERYADRARFDLGTPAGGYGWIFPKADHLSVGVGVFTEGGARRRLRDELCRYLGAVGLGEASVRRVRGAPIPVRPRRAAARGRVLLAGDAAGLADPLTGEGISQAILSGRLAAESLLAARLDARVAARAYVASLRRSVLRELRIARGLAWVLYRRPALSRRLVPRLGQLAGEALTEVVAGRRSYQELVGSGRAWRRLLAALALR
ncbi:MAG TPA: NAD(P)/FAD-dependent oxidoreductase [Methylomirabilota bacterium]